MKRSTAKVLKLTAAQRQLDAAIRMTFAGEDTLAIHTVAAAACRILRDLSAKRGHRVFAEEGRDIVLGIALALARGQLPEADERQIREDAQLWQFISAIAERIKTRINTLGPQKTVAELSEEIEVEFSSATEKEHWT